MPKTIVVPLDDSENSERALPIGVMLARQLNAQLLLISVYEVHPEYARWAREYTWETESYLAGIASRLRPMNVSTLVLTGIDPAIEINDALSEMDDVMLVMSTRGHSGVKRLVLGSKTARIVQLATYPVVVVPVDSQDYTSPVSRILVPLDGSTFAEHALDVTRQIFAGTSPSLHLLRIVDEVWVETHVDAELRQELFADSRSYLDEVVVKLADDEPKVSSDVKDSFDIAETIVSTAEEAGANLIALATHGRSGFSRFFLGSVADAVLRTATMPVLIVRPSESVVAQAPESRSTNRNTN